MIGTEKGLQNEAYLSNEQLDWVDAQLESITSVSSKPVFMICHQPLNGTNRVDEAWAPGKLGAQSDRLKSIIRKYNDHGSTVILASGHLHSGFGYTKPTHENGLYYLDLPSYGKTPSRGNVRETGCGLMVEIYNDKIVCRARNFASGKFYESYNYNIPVETQEKALIPAA